MSRSINQARSEAATRKFFSVKADEPEPMPPDECRMSREDWESLSPGMRRAISREFAHDPEPQEERISPDERKRQVEYEGRKRL